jgi:ankyrin repeat protein
MTWLAMGLLVTSCGLAQEPVKEPTAPPWPEGLITAIQANDLPAVKESLEQGAEVNARDNGGWTPLMIAANYSSTPEIVTLLLEKGADALAKDEDGKKAIDYAKENDQLKDTKAYWKLHDQSFE